MTPDSREEWQADMRDHFEAELDLLDVLEDESDTDNGSYDYD